MRDDGPASALARAGLTAKQALYLSLWACPPYLTLQEIGDRQTPPITKSAVCQVIRAANEKLSRAGLPTLRPPKFGGKTIPMDPSKLCQMRQRRDGRYDFEPEWR